MPHRAGSLPLVGRKHVVELENAGEEAGKQFPNDRIRDPANPLRQNRKAQQLPIIEHLVPVPVVVTERLIRVVARLDPNLRERTAALCQLLARLFVQVAVRFGRHRVHLPPVRREDQLRIQPVGRRPVPHPSRLGDREPVRAVGTRRLLSRGRAGPWVEPLRTSHAGHLGRVVPARVHLPARRADALRTGVPLGIRMACEHSRRKQVHWGSALRAIHLLDPEVVEDVRSNASVKFGPVVRLDRLRHVALDLLESLQHRFVVVDGQGISHEKVGHGIDVATDRPRTQLEGFADGRTAAHERIEYDHVLQAHRAVERVHDIRAGRRQRTQQNRTESRPEPLRPPLVNVIRRAIDLLSPTLGFGDVADRFERKTLVFKRARAFEWRKDILRIAVSP